MTTRKNATVRQWVLWFGFLAAATVVLLLLRGRLDKAHFALVFLLVVLGGSAAGGRRLGITLAAVAFLVFDIGFLPPYNTLVLADPFDWIVLVAFLATGVIAAELLERQRAEAVRLARTEDEAESLRRANRLKDGLLASVSHDLRTPLTTIKGIANEIARGGDATRAYVIEEEADRLTSVVDDLLDLSQLAAGEMESKHDVNTADDVVGVALERVESAFPGRVIETILEGKWTELVGRFDSIHTIRILTNLLENAAKYAPPDSQITLRVWRAADTLNFSIEDPGERIAADEEEKMFEPFFRGSSRKPGSNGTGLGLSIARRLAEIQGGNLAYEAAGERGNRFVLSLPAADVNLANSEQESL